MHAGRPMYSAPTPIAVEHDGIFVVRDDLFPGGTKARFLGALFDHADEVVYASPSEGGAQTALATVAARLGKLATIFVADRNAPHARTVMAERLGANVQRVRPGHLSVVQARARAYAKARGAFLAPFGIDVPCAVPAIAAAAKATRLEPDEVWCAAGSGVLCRGMAAAWTKARLNAVQVGRPLDWVAVSGATVHVSPWSFSEASTERTPFPSDPHYDAKAWSMCKARRRAGLVLFWNCTGPAEAAPC